MIGSNWPPPTGPVEEFGTRVDADREARAFPYTIHTSNPVGGYVCAVGVARRCRRRRAAAESPSTAASRPKTVNTGARAVRLPTATRRAATVSHPQNATHGAVAHVQHVRLRHAMGRSACGRVDVSQSHVSSGGGAFLGGCWRPRRDDAAGEGVRVPLLQRYGLSRSSARSPLPPPPPVLPTGVTYTADFVGTCPSGTQPLAALRVAGERSGSTSITFRAQPPTPLRSLPRLRPLRCLRRFRWVSATDANAFTDAVGWTYDTSGALRSRRVRSRTISRTTRRPPPSLRQRCAST